MAFLGSCNLSCAFQCSCLSSLKSSSTALGDRCTKNSVQPNVHQTAPFNQEADLLCLFSYSESHRHQKHWPGRLVYTHYKDTGAERYLCNNTETMEIFGVDWPVLVIRTIVSLSEENYEYKRKPKPMCQLSLTSCVSFKYC